MNPEEEQKEKEVQVELDQEAAVESPAAESEQTEGEDLQKQLEEANAQVDDLKDRYLRLSAEFDNYRKRTAKEKAELIRTGGSRVVESMLPVLDDLERALASMEATAETAAMKEGVELIYGKFLKTLGENGVSPIETEGKPFDTDYHEAVALVPAPTEAEKGKILDCVQRGYVLHDKVIRHAKVVVAQ